jgi:hypothetical protein
MIDPVNVPTAGYINKTFVDEEEGLRVHWASNFSEYCLITTDGSSPPAVVHNTTLNSDPGIDVPKHYKDIQSTNNQQGWNKSVKTELDNLSKRNVFGNKMKLPAGKRALSTCWIFKWKQDPKEPGKKFEKARLVVRGYEQIPGVDFTKTFLPVASNAAFRTVLAKALYQASRFEDWTADIVDVETAFLNTPLMEDIFVKVPDGYDQHSGVVSEPGDVLKLNRALLEKSPTILWAKTINLCRLPVFIYRVAV